MKKITPDNIDQWFFQFAEGELNSTQKEALHTYVHAADKELELDAWQQANLRDMPVEKYPNMDKLIQKKPFAWTGKRVFFLGIMVGLMAWIPFAFDRPQQQVESPVQVPEATINREEHTKVAPIKEAVKEANQIDMKARPTTKSSVVPVVSEDDEVTPTTIMMETEEETDIRTALTIVDQRTVNELTAAASRRKLQKRIYVKPVKSKKQLRQERREARKEARKPDVHYLNGNGPGVIPIDDMAF